MVQSVVRIVQPHMECRKHKNIPLVPLAKNIVTKTDALVTGASLVYRVYGWCHSRVFTAEWLRIKPIREATKLCTQHCTGECVSISKCDYAMPTQSNRSKGEKKKRCDRRQDYLQSHMMLHKRLYVPQSRVLSNSCVTQHQKVPKLWNAPSAGFSYYKTQLARWILHFDNLHKHHRVDS